MASMHCTAPYMHGRYNLTTLLLCPSIHHVSFRRVLLATVNLKWLGVLHSSRRGWRVVSRSFRRQDRYFICRDHFGIIVRSISCLRNGGTVSVAPGQHLLSNPRSHGRLCEVVIAANIVLPSPNSFASFTITARLPVSHL